MTDPGAPRRGRHASPDEGWGAAAPSWPASPPSWPAQAPGRDAAPYVRSGLPGDWSTVGMRQVSGLLQDADATGPVPQWRHRGTGEDPESHEHGEQHGDPLPRDDRYDGHFEGHHDGQYDGHHDGQYDDYDDAPGGTFADSGHPSAPLPPLPRGAWSRMQSRSGADDDETAAADALPADGEADTAGHAFDWDRTGGLEVIGAHVEEDEPRRGRHDRAAEAFDDDDDLHDDLDADRPAGHGAVDDDDIPIAPYDPRPQRRRKRRKRAALVVCLVVLAAVVGGVVFGGQKMWGMFHSPDWTGTGTGSATIRVHQGDTLTDIGTTMVSGGVIASVRPFTKAAEADTRATGIAPGLYGLRKHMSAKAALDLLLKPSSRLVSRVTLPEGVTVKQTLQRLADGTGVPLAELQAAAADPAGLGLPAYANGMLEGFLFPATYDFEPGTTAEQMLTAMVTRTTQVLDKLAIPAEQRLGLLTEASIVQAESGSSEDMPKVARVLDNRLAINMPLQLDTTVNYANGKSGLTTTPEDRLNPSPYNTYLHLGLPPGAISNPGEDALQAVLAPAQGDWLYFVVVDPDTGETRFAVTGEEHKANVNLFRQWLAQHPGG